MAHRPIRPKTRKESNLSIDQVEHLIHGYCLDGCQPCFGNDTAYPFRDDDHRRECWKRNKKYLMSLEGGDPRHDISFYGLSYPVGEKPVAYIDYEIVPEQMPEGNINLQP